MRARYLACLAVTALLLAAAGCGESEPGGDSAAGAEQAAGATASGSAGKSGGTSSGASSSGDAGASASGSSSTGGRPGGSGGESMAGGGPGDAGADSGPGGGLVDCDTRKIMCRRAAPVCGTFEVPSIEGICYGPCVKIDQCACNGADECPDANEYTCWMSTHCGPYVQ